MNNETNLISNAFKTFSDEAPEYADAWMRLVQDLSKASALDQKTHNLARIFHPES